MPRYGCEAANDGTKRGRISYSLPNFYFHVVTAYDILRTRGVPIGKGDYEGRLRARSD